MQCVDILCTPNQGEERSIYYRYTYSFLLRVSGSVMSTMDRGRCIIALGWSTPVYGAMDHQLVTASHD